MSNVAWVAGTPRFEDPLLSDAERSGGAAAAWQLALQRGPGAALPAARGHFAAGVADPQGRVMLAVDRFGTETVCWSAQGNAAPRFGERADTLAPDRNAIDLQALYGYLYQHAIPAPMTIFKGVQRLPAGHALVHDAAGTRIQRYWQPRFDEQRPRFDDARREFRTLLADAVRRQLDGSTPACFLSGGTDSSTVAGLICEVAGRPAETYSIGFDAQGYDEMEYARIAARHFGTRHHEHYVTPAVLVRHIPEMAAHLDQPFGNSSLLPAYYCALKAKEDGVTRLLAGDGGDELFGGNTRYAKQSVFAWYDGIPAGLRRGLIEPLVGSGALDPLPLLKKGASYVRQARVPMPDRTETYNLLDRLGRDEVLTPAFLAQVDTSGPLKQQRAVWVESEGASFLNRMLAYDWRFTLAENDLHKVRYATRAAGMAVNYPFLDQAVVDFSARLPTDYKLRRLKLRWFFKEALRGFLPDEIITKKKHGFGLPFGVWAVQDEALRTLARDSVRGVGERGIVRREFTTALMDRHLPAHPGYYGEMVWILMMLEQWFRHHAPDFRLQDR